MLGRLTSRRGATATKPAKIAWMPDSQLRLCSAVGSGVWSSSTISNLCCRCERSGDAVCGELVGLMHDEECLW